MKRRIPFALAAAALIGSAQAQTKWDMPTPYPDGNFHTKNARQFAEDDAKATAGKLQIQVHANASLIKHPEIKRAVQTGQVPIGEVLISVLANESPLFAFDSIPFLADSYAKERKLWQAARLHIESRLDGQGIKLLYSVPWPPQGIYTKKEIHALSDLKGTKFRTYSPTTSRFAELIGAVPTTVQVPDVPQAFRTGLVDAMLTSGATGVDSQAWDYLQYYYDTQAFLPQNMVIAGKAALGKLGAGEQQAVLGAAKEAEARGWKTSETENEGYVKTMASHGIKIMKPSARLSSEFDAIGKKIADEWAAKAGVEGGTILKAFHK